MLRVRRIAVAGIYLFVAAILTGACGGNAPVASNRWRVALSPALFGKTISLQQHVQVDQSGRSDDFDAVLDITPDSLTLVGLKFNQRVFTLVYDNVKIRESRSRMLPKEVQAADVLSDMQLALWPTQALRPPTLPGGVTMMDNGSVRTFSRNDSTLMTINYSTNVRWIGTINIDNKEFNYRLVIKSAENN